MGGPGETWFQAISFCSYIIYGCSMTHRTWRYVHEWQVHFTLGCVPRNLDQLSGWNCDESHAGLIISTQGSDVNYDCPTSAREVVNPNWLALGAFGFEATVGFQTIEPSSGTLVNPLAERKVLPGDHHLCSSAAIFLVVFQWIRWFKLLACEEVQISSTSADYVRALIFANNYSTIVTN